MTTVAGTEPYPWPYHGRLDPSRLALVVAGAQPAWLRRSGGVDAVAAAIEAVAAAARRVGATVVVLTHTAAASAAGSRPPLPPAAGSIDAELLGVAAHADVVVDATGTSGFSGSRLDAELRRRGVELLVLVGYGGEVTVDSTLRGANDRGYECLTLTDAVAPFDEQTGRHALHSITMSGGIFGAIGTSTELLAALEAVAAEAGPPPRPTPPSATPDPRGGHP